MEMVDIAELQERVFALVAEYFQYKQKTRKYWLEVHRLAVAIATYSAVQIAYTFTKDE